MAAFTACEPSEDDKSLGSVLQKSDLKLSISQLPAAGGNKIVLRNNTPGTMAYWDYSVGTSSRQVDTVFVPFRGTYKLAFAGYGAGGVVRDTLTYTVEKNDLSGFASEPRWNQLTNGEKGKTWVLNMVRPIGWYGLDYKKGSGDDWSWQPNLSEIGWAGIDATLNYGKITFNLDGGFNVAVTRLNASKATVNEAGKYSVDWAAGTIKLIGAEMPNITNYYSQVSNWGNLKILEFSPTQMVLGVLRDQSSDGKAYIGFTFIPLQ